MDNDELRRGKPTNHVIYGEDVAILAGDSLLSTSFEHVARETKDVTPDKIVEVIARLGRSVGAEGLAGGQVMDLECEGKPNTTLEDLKWIHIHKTAGKDEAVDKTTYVKLMGLEGSKRYARELIDEAKGCLEPFGDRAAPLLAIADYIVDRKN